MLYGSGGLGVPDQPVVAKKYPEENLCNGDLVKGLTESDYLNGQLEKG
jgi:hypothetical protein